MAFYGLSVEVWNGHDVTGTSLSTARRLLYRSDDETVTMGAGDSFVIAAFGPSGSAGDNVPTVNDDVAIAWALEVDAASAGVIRLRTGTTTGADISDAACTEDLGTFALVSGQTLAIPQSSYTVDDYFDSNVNTNLSVEWVSGTVVLRQAKLRVWPSAGVGGAWVTARDVVGTGFGGKTGRVSRFGDVTVNASGTGDTYQGAAEAAVLAAQRQLLTLSGAPYVSSIADLLISDGEAAVESHAGTSGNWNGAARLTDNYGWIYAEPQKYPAQSPTGARDPNEVWGEPGAEVRPIGGPPGDVLGSFHGWTGDLLVSSISSTHFPPSGWSEEFGWPLEGGFIYQITVGMVPTENDTTRLYEPLAGGAPFMSVGIRRSLNPADQVVPIHYEAGECILILCRPRGVFGSPPKLVTYTIPDQENWDAQHRIEVSAGPSGLTFAIAYPDFLYYDPTAKPTTPTRKPRFYVTFTEVDDDPREVSHIVGIGKPADDASIFRVPTPLGTLRELRHGEKVSDVSVAYPLKVKLEDGSWTVVAGMTPDD